MTTQNANISIGKYQKTQEVAPLYGNVRARDLGVTQLYPWARAYPWLYCFSQHLPARFFCLVAIRQSWMYNNVHFTFDSISIIIVYVNVVDVYCITNRYSWIRCSVWCVLLNCCDSFSFLCITICFIFYFLLNPIMYGYKLRYRLYQNRL